MKNILEGLQFRSPKPVLPSWGQPKYTDWIDITRDSSFSTSTQFRVAPKFEYVVTFNGTTDVATTDKNRAMGRVASLVDQGFTVEIDKNELATQGVSAFLADRNIQYKLLGDNKWIHGQYFNNNVTAPIEFRERPDYYWRVQVQNGIALSSLEFDDVDKLDKYISNQLRTSENNINITRVAYGTNLTIL